MKQVRGKHLSKLGKIFGYPRRFYENDWLYRRRLEKRLYKDKPDSTFFGVADIKRIRLGEHDNETPLW